MLPLQLHNFSQTQQLTPILLVAFLRLILVWETVSLSIGRLPQPTWLTYEGFPLFRFNYSTKQPWRCNVV